MINYLLYLALVLSLAPQAPFNWVSFKMEKRANRDGKTTKLNADIYFGRKGEMVTHFTSPAEVYILNNKKGELSVYNPEINSVYQSVNYQAGSESTTFYYFLMNQSADMGLNRIGFKLSDSKVDGKLLINIWEPPQEIPGLADIELVRDSGKPIFMGYRDKKGKYVKKVFYYNYEFFRGINFPMAITEIDYVEQDSIVSKTTFNSFQFDMASDQEMLQFQIPKDAVPEK
ncbi:MAG: hypothetical protein RIM99_04525 [Cyclobacteriaceae bacterium]